MQFVPLNRPWNFTVFDYTQTDKDVIGYECVFCKWIYAQGRYGLEAANLIVCHEALVRCASCDGLIPSPVLWHTLGERDMFFEEIHTKGGRLLLRPMTRAWPIRVLCPVDS
jgi:hypothetical protein